MTQDRSPSSAHDTRRAADPNSSTGGRDEIGDGKNRREFETEDSCQPHTMEVSHGR